MLGATVLAACGGGAAPTATPEPLASETAASISVSSPTPDPAAACEGVEAAEATLEIEIQTVSFAFDTPVIEGPRHCEPFLILFTNNDTQSSVVLGAPKHDIDIRANNILGPILFDGALIDAGQIRYEVSGLPAGEHYFFCSVHPEAMNGDVVVAP